MNNLKQIGLACAPASRHLRQVSPGVGPGTPFTVPQGKIVQGGHGFFPFLLPFLEQEALAKIYRWDKRSQGPENQPVATTQLKVLQCPSAEPDRWVTAVEDPSNYSLRRQGRLRRLCGRSGHRYPPGGSRTGGPRQPNIEGVLTSSLVTTHYLTRLADITDGTSQTLLVTECAGRPELWRAGGPVPEIYAIPNGAWVGGTLIFFQGSTPDGATRPGPCAINCTNDQEAYSFHPAGVNAVFADGSVHFLNADIDIRIFARLVTRAGEEVVEVP